MARQYRKYTDNDILEKSKAATSIRTLLISLGLKPVGGNYANIKKHLQRLQVDTSHWTGQGWTKEKQLKENWSDYTRVSRLKLHVIKQRGRACEKCRLTSWLKEKIPLQIHHKNGNRTDNRKENLEILCPNCHAQTDNWCGRKS